MTNDQCARLRAITDIELTRPMLVLVPPDRPAEHATLIRTSWPTAKETVDAPRQLISTAMCRGHEALRNRSVPCPRVTRTVA